MKLRAVEVAKRARLLVDDLRNEGFDERSIMLGLAIATQAAPVTKALEGNPAARRILDRLGPLVQEGIGLIAEIKSLKRG